ncbi:unnamed protein product, partial [Rotaria magnacalcarata]
MPLEATTSVVRFPSFNSRAGKVAHPFGYCDRGFFVSTNGGTQYQCFCPPSFYGNRCQFNRRRITVRVRFDRYHRHDLPPIIHVLFLLLFNNSQIFDHQTFADVDLDFPTKHQVYLLYPPSKPNGIYSIRLEAYHSTNILAVWNYPITPLDFLPVLRIAKILRFPDHALPGIVSNYLCRNNGTSYRMNNGEGFCLCQRGWRGIHCEERLENIKCSIRSIARDRDICICPDGYLEPHCFVRQNICARPRLCQSNERCHPLSVQPPKQYACICNDLSCDTRKPLMFIHRNESNEYPILLQLLKIRTDYTNVRQQILISASMNFPINRTMNTNNALYKQNGPPEVGLLFAFQPEKRSVKIIVHLLFVNCSPSIQNYSVDLSRQLRRCRLLNGTERQLVTHFHKYCREPICETCFMSESYLCYCNLKAINRSECMPYQQRNIVCPHCLNQGLCVQGDLQNKSDFVCVCPKCASGKLRQFASNRFVISLEFLIEKTNWDHLHFIGPVLFVIFGLIFNGLCIMTFTKRNSHQTGTGFYLLINALTSQLVLFFFLARTYYLYMIRRMIIRSAMNISLCKALPFTMSYLNYVSLWLMAWVTLERALGVMFPTRFSSIRKPKSAAIIILLTFVFMLALTYIHIDQYKLVSHPESLYSWCIQEIESGQAKLIQYTSMAHRFSPFLVNLVADVIIILAIGRSKATTQHRSIRSTLLKQVQQRIDLLLGPIACFITQLPQLIILFLDACDYNQKS